ncbi:hypothetical protein ACFP81_08325 [Deinococcus lacus]|uniref:DUF3592 domain-containing protein n=1 Tax=Deinococcus lacus TaxID=392561 RepID=A0ABW1YFR5_9DEIO
MTLGHQKPGKLQLHYFRRGEEYFNEKRFELWGVGGHPEVIEAVWQGRPDQRPAPSGVPVWVGPVLVLGTPLVALIAINGEQWVAQGWFWAAAAALLVGLVLLGARQGRQQLKKMAADAKTRPGMTILVRGAPVSAAGRPLETQPVPGHPFHQLEVSARPGEWIEVLPPTSPAAKAAATKVALHFPAATPDDILLCQRGHAQYLGRDLGS